MRLAIAKQISIAFFITLAMTALVAGCGGGKKELYDPAAGTVANSTISGSVKIKGETGCSGVVVVAEKTTDGVTRTVELMLSGAKAGNRAAYPASATAGGVYTATSNADCSFTMAVPAATYSVSAYKEEALGATPQRVAVRAAEVVTVNFELVATGKISGTVKLGNPGSDIVVAFIDGTSYAAFASADGSYTISNVPVGIYTLKFSRNGVIYAASDGVEVVAGIATVNSLTTMDITCVMDSDCADSDFYTVDVCVNAATTSSTCEHAISTSSLLSSGGRHVCQLMPDGTVKCWGDNSRGQCGVGYVSGEGVWTGYRKLSRKSATGSRSISPAEADELQREEYSARAGSARTASSIGPIQTDIFIYEPTTVVGLSNVVQVAAGDWVSCALISNGTVKCWGGNTDKELGDGTTVQNSPVPVDVVGITDARQISVRNDTVCALLSDGSIMCWGSGSQGELGNGGVQSSNVPVRVAGISGALQVSAGDWHGCALMPGGKAKCWGSNYNGELGAGTTSPHSRFPVDVVGLSGASSIEAGGDITCALFPAGTVKCWGRNDMGQLGIGTTVNTSFPTSLNLTGVTAVRPGERHSCAVLSDGSARCWGFNQLEQLGNNQNLTADTIYELSPVPVLKPQGTIIEASPSARNDFTCFLMADHSVECAGYGYRGQLGDGRSEFNTSARAELGLTNVLNVSITANHACAAHGDETVTCWGLNGPYGLLGDGNNFGWNKPVVNVGNLSMVMKVATGASHNCALRSNNTVYCWGNNAMGQLGTADNSDYMVPTIVQGLWGTIMDIDAGENHTCALADDGSVLCWGAGGTGQLGDGQYIDSNVPVAAVVSGATSISAGGNVTCAVIGGGPTGGSAQCWGDNGGGQLGDGNIVAASGPVDVSDGLGGVLGGIMKISAGNIHTCALMYGGSIKCWGYNSHGQFGDSNSGTQSSVPVDTLNITNATDIYAGNNYTCAILADGSAACWGSNDNLALGNGDMTPTMATTPTTVLGLTGAASLGDGGLSRMCAITTSFELYCWGRDLYYSGMAW